MSLVYRAVMSLGFCGVELTFLSLPLISRVLSLASASVSVVIVSESDSNMISISLSDIKGDQAVEAESFAGEQLYRVVEAVIVETVNFELN